MQSFDWQPISNRRCFAFTDQFAGFHEFSEHCDCVPVSNSKRQAALPVGNIAVLCYELNNFLSDFFRDFNIYC